MSTRLEQLLQDLRAGSRIVRRSTDEITYLAVFALLAFASLAASLLPARSAARIDPIALRYE